MKRLIYLVLIFPILGSCTPDPANTTIYDKWKRDGYNVYLTVNENGTQHGEYTIPGDPTNTQYSVDGTFTIHADTFRFVSSSGVSSCAYGDTGTYSFNVNETQLQLVLIHEQCTGRSMYMPGTWTRQ